MAANNYNKYDEEIVSNIFRKLNFCRLVAGS